VYPLLTTVNTDDGSGYNSQEATFSTQKLFTIFCHGRTYKSDLPDSSHGGQHLDTEQPQQWRTCEQPFLIFTHSVLTGMLHLRCSCNPFMSKQGA